MGLLPDFSYPHPAERVAVVEAWATALGLEHNAEATPGTTGYTGTVRGIQVQVWAVTDQGAYDAYFAEARARYSS